MAGTYVYPYPRPMVTVDLVVFAVVATGLRVLLIRRGRPPYQGQWAIPGGYLEIDEEIETAARRELHEETGLSNLSLIEEIGVFGRPGRDPRGRTISIAHAAVLAGIPAEVKGGDDAQDAAWLDPSRVENLAFDHSEILERAREWLVRKAEQGDRFLNLLAPEFSVGDLKRLRRSVLGHARQTHTIIHRWRAWGCIEIVEGSPETYRQITSRSDS